MQSRGCILMDAFGSINTATKPKTSSEYILSDESDWGYIQYVACMRQTKHFSIRWTVFDACTAPTTSGTYTMPVCDGSSRWNKLVAITPSLIQSRLKPSFFCKSYLFFFTTHSVLHGFPGLLTDTSELEHIRFYFLVFFLFSFFSFLVPCGRLS